MVDCSLSKQQTADILDIWYSSVSTVHLTFLDLFFMNSFSWNEL